MENRSENTGSSVERDLLEYLSNLMEDHKAGRLDTQSLHDMLHRIVERYRRNSRRSDPDRNQPPLF